MNNEQDAVVVAVLRRALPELVAVYRFGSSATGTQGPDSDIDLAVLSPGRLAPRARFDLQEDIAAALRRPVDLVDLRAASSVMAIQVVSTGELLFDADPEARGRFEDFTYGIYARFNEERRGILQRISREGTVYG